MFAIYKRELRGYFTSMTGYVFLGLILAFAGIFMNNYNLAGAHPAFEYVPGNMTFIYLLVVPVLSMRVIAEERRQKTDQLLYALPLKAWSIVLGKYLAMLTVLFIACLMMCTMPFALTVFGPIHIAAALSGMLGFFLLGAALLAVGMFTSSLTDNQIIAAVLSFGAVLLFFIMGAVAGIIPASSSASLSAFFVVVLIIAAIVYAMTRNINTTTVFLIVAMVLLFGLYIYDSKLFEGAFSSALMTLSVFQRMNNFVYNILDITGIVYYLGIVFLFSFFTVQALEKRRWS
ncbi:MAG: ABC transporter permease [Christensenellales bacterium]|jgi:ABC-2 type transport system permease protein